ncbi:Homeobox domain - like 10 [Theobroma cacao]|nr:Homeobox domain - like 10 [Theobroma cacao]
MDIARGNIGSSDDEQKASTCHEKGRIYHRHTTHQIQTLEAFFKECAHPDENQRRELSKELGLEPKQIKFWFQNKRTQTKARKERAENSILRASKESLLYENTAMREAMAKMVCVCCGSPLLPEPQAGHGLHQLELENTQLKQGLEKLTKFLANYINMHDHY